MNDVEKEINQEKRAKKDQSKKKKKKEKKKKKNRKERRERRRSRKGRRGYDIRVNTSGNVRESACACTLVKRAMNVGTRGGKLVPRTNTRLQ